MMKEQMSMKAEYGQAWAIVWGRGEEEKGYREWSNWGRRPSPFDGGGRGTTAAIGGDTGEGASAFPSLLLNHGARIALSDSPPLVLLQAKPSDEELYHMGAQTHPQ